MALTRRKFIAQGAAATTVALGLLGNAPGQAAVPTADQAAALVRLKAVHGELVKHMADFVSRAKAQTDTGLTLQMPTVNSNYFGFWPDDCLWPFIAVPSLADKREMQGAIGFLTDSIVDLRYVPDRVEKDGLPVLSPGGTDGGAITQHMALHLPAAWIRRIVLLREFRRDDPAEAGLGGGYSAQLRPSSLRGRHGLFRPADILDRLRLPRHDSDHRPGTDEQPDAVSRVAARNGAVPGRHPTRPRSPTGRGSLPASRPTCIGCTMTASAAHVGGTRKGRQFSVWANGVAYSLAPPTVKAKIAQFYHDNRAKIFLKGCTRQIAEDGWTGNGPGNSYQNGGFWATGTGFVLPAIYASRPGIRGGPGGAASHQPARNGFRRVAGPRRQRPGGEKFPRQPLSSHSSAWTASSTTNR